MVDEQRVSGVDKQSLMHGAIGIYTCGYRVTHDRIWNGTYPNGERHREQYGKHGYGPVLYQFAAKKSLSNVVLPYNLFAVTYVHTLETRFYVAWHAEAWSVLVQQKSENKIWALLYSDHLCGWSLIFRAT